MQEDIKPQVATGIRTKKLRFDRKFSSTNPLLKELFQKQKVETKSCEFMKNKKNLMTLNSAEEFKCFCYWHPELFGVDEEFIPSSDEEGLFEDLFAMEELEERANLLTQSDYDCMRTGTRKLLSNRELHTLWKEDQIPKYGRRARRKPVLEKKNKVKFECICNIDRSFSRHYVPHFGGGKTKSKEELRTPHFVAFWEEYKDRRNRTSEVEDWEKVIETKVVEASPQDNGLFFRPVPKFPSSCRTEMKKYRKQLLASFRPLECREIRRFRMPFAEALYLELQEDRYINSAQFFKNILAKEYMFSKSSNYVPTLMKNKGRMKQLTSFLKIAERFSKKKEYHKEAVILLKSGKYFNDHNENWWWIAEELYKKAVEVSCKSIIDGGKSEAISRYVLGTFYLECVNRVQLAQEELSKAIELSLGKDWNATNILNKKQEPVHKECTNYLCQALIASSKELRNNKKPEEALPLIHRSYKLCLECRTSRRDIEAETYFELGIIYQSLGMLDWAKTAFKKFIEIAKLENYHRRVCDGYLELAITYRSEEDLGRCHHSLMSYLETAENNNDENLIAFANRYLGEYHLNNGNPEVAAEFFRKAFQSFHKQCLASLKVPLTWWKPEFFTLPHDVELTRVLMGLAIGETVTKPICQLILQAKGVRNQEETLKLMVWRKKRDVLTDVEDVNEDEFLMYDADELDSGIFRNVMADSPEATSNATLNETVEEDYYKTVKSLANKTGKTII